MDRLVPLAPGEPHFERVSAPNAPLIATVEPADLATAELFPTGELLVTATRQGRGLLFLAGAEELEVWQLDVGQGSPSQTQTELAPLAKSCPGTVLDTDSDKGPVLRLHVANESCRAAAKVFLQGGSFTDDRVKTVFELPALQTQLREMQSRLSAAGLGDITLAYAGATLTLRGSADAATRAKILRTLWPEAVGHLTFDDQLDLPSPPRESLHVH